MSDEPSELAPCVCGVKPEWSGSGMVDCLRCSGCGREGSAFFDGADEWLIEDWNRMIAKLLEEGEVNGSGI